MKDYELEARSLVMSFSLLGIAFEVAKLCAIISVNKAISACEYNNVESWNTDWWNKVKNEIKTL